ncbi:MAG: hypothetical protein HY541_07130, partial [Deltaproteobacteria bacterium]|nr:hypothetical protein [Deltaproteobacteria bacterium]
DIRNAAVLLEVPGRVHAKAPLDHFGGQIEMTGKFFGVVEKNDSDAWRARAMEKDGLEVVEGEMEILSSTGQDRLVVRFIDNSGGRGIEEEGDFEDPIGDEAPVDEKPNENPLLDPDNPQWLARIVQNKSGKVNLDMSWIMREFPSEWSHFEKLSAVLERFTVGGMLRHVALIDWLNEIRRCSFSERLTLINILARHLPNSKTESFLAGIVLIKNCKNSFLPQVYRKPIDSIIASLENPAGPQGASVAVLPEVVSPTSASSEEYRSRRMSHPHSMWELENLSWLLKAAVSEERAGYGIQTPSDVLPDIQSFNGYVRSFNRDVRWFAVHILTDARKQFVDDEVRQAIDEVLKQVKNAPSPNNSDDDWNRLNHLAKALELVSHPETEAEQSDVLHLVNLFEGDVIHEDEKLRQEAVQILTEARGLFKNKEVLQAIDDMLAQATKIKWPRKGEGLFSWAKRMWGELTKDEDGGILFDEAPVDDDRDVPNKTIGTGRRVWGPGQGIPMAKARAERRLGKNIESSNKPKPSGGGNALGGDAESVIDTEPSNPRVIGGDPAPFQNAILAARRSGKKVIVEVGCGEAPVAFLERAKNDPDTQYFGIDPWLLDVPFDFDIPANVYLYQGKAAGALRGLAEQEAVDEIQIIAPNGSENDPTSVGDPDLGEPEFTFTAADVSLFYSLLKDGGSLSVYTEGLTWADDFTRFIEDVFNRTTQITLSRKNAPTSDYVDYAMQKFIFSITGYRDPELSSGGRGIEEGGGISNEDFEPESAPISGLPAWEPMLLDRLSPQAEIISDIAEKDGESGEESMTDAETITADIPSGTALNSSWLWPQTTGPIPAFSGAPMLARSARVLVIR